MPLAAVVDGFVHEPTQTEGPGVDLTVDSIFRVTGPGSVDFGGAELDPAACERLPVEKRAPDDDYGWWNLTAGVYLIEHNETLSVPEEQTVVLQTREAVRARGAFHPTLYLMGDQPLEHVPFTVGDGGLNLKENARVSTLLVA